MSFFQRLVDHFLTFERRHMSDIDTINAKLDGLAAAYRAESDKTALMITGFADLKARVAHMQTRMDEGSTITSTDIASVLGRIDEITSSVNSMAAKEDVALAPDPVAPPSAPVVVADPAPVPAAPEPSPLPSETPVAADPAPVAPVETPVPAEPAPVVDASAPELVPGTATVAPSVPAPSDPVAPAQS